tara:strand:- start:215 stop:1198 length:984 start_codon:yes stop_codon:yes gene_type:complete
MEQQQEWGEVKVEKEETPKVEFEVEEEKKEEVKEEPKQEIKEEPKEEPKKEEPKELEGIDTKGAQKRIRQLVKQRKEKEEEVARLIRQNEELATRVKKQEEDFYKLGKLNITANEKQIKDKLELARTAYATAHEEGDSAKILKAQEALNEAQVDLKNIEATKNNFKEPEVQQQSVQQQQVQQPQPQPDPKAEEWAAQNEWFGKDRIMTASALAIDTELKEEGYDPTSSEFYEEINNRLQETFPHKFKVNKEETKEVRKQETSETAQVVAGGTRSTPSSKNKVKLTKEDVRLANKWNIPLEQYAQEKLKATSAEGEYTTINMQRGGKK